MKGTRQDHRPHPQSEMEWWSLAGTTAEGSLFACFWRYRGPGFPIDAWMASAALTPPTPGGRAVTCFVSPTMVHGARAGIERVLRSRTDSVLYTAKEMLDVDRMFRPYTVAEPRLGAFGDLDVELGDLRLQIDDAGTWRLAWRGQGAMWRGWRSWSVCAPVARMKPAQDATYQLAGRKMRGYVLEAGPLARESDARQLAEPAGPRDPSSAPTWLGHHHGPWTLFDADAFYFHPEWRSFAVALPDASLWFVLEQQPRRRERRGLVRIARHYSEDGPVRDIQDLTITALGRVESLRTHNIYESGWRLESASFGLDLTLAPAHRDHEVPIFAPHRGVLELPCMVTGTLAGRTVTGHAHAEVFGLAPDIATFFWGRQKTNLAEQLEAFLPRRHDPQWLARVCGLPGPLAVDDRDIEHALLQPIWSMMDRGGKGWRSTWLSLCCHHLAADNEVLDDQLRDFLPITELLHTGSLIIDDIQDASPLRRGRPAVHCEVGTELAINVGNFLYFLPQMIVEEASWLTPAARAEIYQHIQVALRRGHVGQALDLMWKRADDVRQRLEDPQRCQQQLVEQYRLKSGCQLEAIARIAGTLTGAARPRIEALARYSSDFGVAFQIADDIIDVQETLDTLGKVPGEDLANGKLNFVILHAMHAAQGDVRAQLLGALGGGHDAAMLALLRNAVRETRAIERCVEHAQGMLDSSWKLVADSPPDEHMVAMRAVPRWLLAERLQQR